MELVSCRNYPEPAGATQVARDQILERIIFLGFLIRSLYEYVADPMICIHTATCSGSHLLVGEILGIRVLKN